MRKALLAIGIALVWGTGASLAADPAPTAGQPAADAAPAAKKDASADEKPAAKPATEKKVAKKSANTKAAKGAASGASDEQIADQLKRFCVKWMGFLETRERDNQKGIKWQKKPDGVAGHYVGYSKEYDCVMKERSSNGTPVATIEYRELVYEKTGPSQAEAEKDQADVIDATEVTEIFRYTKGEWVY